MLLHRVAPGEGSPWCHRRGANRSLALLLAGVVSRSDLISTEAVGDCPELATCACADGSGSATERHEKAMPRGSLSPVSSLNRRVNIAISTCCSVQDKDGRRGVHATRGWTGQPAMLQHPSKLGYGSDSSTKTPDQTVL